MIRMSWKCLAVGAAILVALPTASSAFDGSRSGFILGFGLGAGSAKQTFEASGGGSVSVSADISQGGLATDFKIGGGVNEQTWIYYHAQNIIFSYEEVSDALSQDITFVQGISGLGVTYFLASEAPSFFFDATLGAGAFLAFTDDDSSGETGFGLQVGAGYEFSPSWAVQGAVMRTVLDQDTVGDTTVEVSVSNALVALTWTGY